MHASCHSLITRELLHDWLSVASAARRYIWGASLANGMILRGFLAISKISSSVHSTLRRIAIEIEISPFTRLLAVKVATRAFTDFVEIDDEEVRLARSVLQLLWRIDVTSNFVWRVHDETNCLKRTWKNFLNIQSCKIIYNFNLSDILKINT